MGEEMDDIIILIDENGSEVEAEYIDTIEYNGNSYVVLLPRDEHEHGQDCDCAHAAEQGGTEEECDCEEEEVVILKVEQGSGDGEETFIAIEDEAEQDAVFEIFQQRMAEAEYDGDGFDGEDE